MADYLYVQLIGVSGLATEIGDKVPSLGTTIVANLPPTLPPTIHALIIF
jgi:hypothetical protein